MDAATPVLLLSTAAQGSGTARTPRALAKAGFDVTLLTPRNSLAECSRFVSRIAYLPDAATPLVWIHALAATVRAISPRLLVPCDDMSFRLLAMLANSPPPQMQPELAAELAALVSASLGDPAHYRTSVDKSRVYAAAAKAGVRVPASSIVTSSEDAGAFGGQHGYPLVVKQPHPVAGGSVQIVADRERLGSAIAAFRADVGDELEPDPARPMIVQQYIDGPVYYQTGVAWRGHYLAGYAAERLEAQGGPTGAGTVVRCRDVPALRDFSAQLAEAFGISGLFTCEYAIEQTSGLPYLLGIDRRAGPTSHFGGILDVDLCAALFAATQRLPSPTRSRPGPDESRVFVHFPAEWLRDPLSPWLRRYPVDVPWDDPDLLDAMLALHSER